MNKNLVEFYYPFFQSIDNALIGKRINLNVIFLKKGQPYI